MSDDNGVKNNRRRRPIYDDSESCFKDDTEKNKEPEMTNDVDQTEVGPMLCDIRSLL